jgi:hypothetical protein
MVNGPPKVGGPFGTRQSNQKLIVAGVRHYLIRDHTGLEGLDVLAMGTRRLSEHRSCLSKSARVQLVGGQKRQALTDAGLVYWLTGTRNSGVQSESCQEGYR